MRTEFDVYPCPICGDVCDYATEMMTFSAYQCRDCRNVLIGIYGELSREQKQTIKLRKEKLSTVRCKCGCTLENGLKREFMGIDFDAKIKMEQYTFTCSHCDKTFEVQLDAL